MGHPGKLEPDPVPLDTGLDFALFLSPQLRLGLFLWSD